MLRTYKENVIWKTFEVVKNIYNLKEYDVLLFIVFIQKYKIINPIFYTSFTLSKLKSNFYNFNISNKFDLIKVFEIFEDDLKRIGDKKIKEIFSILESYSNDKNLDLKNQFELFFQEIINLNNDDSIEYNPPIEILKLMLSLANVTDNSKIYNPFSGTGSLGLLLKDNQVYTAKEFNKKKWAVGIMRLMIANKSIQNFTYEENVNELDINNIQDVIISIFPHKIELFDTLYDYIFNVEKGKPIVVHLPLDSFKLSLSESMNLAKWIDTIIYLPKGLMYRSSGSIIIKLALKSEANNIKFVDASDFLDKNNLKLKKLNEEKLIAYLTNHNNIEGEFIKHITLDEIKDNNYELFPKLYFLKNVKGISVDSFSNIIIENKFNIPTKGKLINNQLLSEDIWRFELDLENISTSDLSDSVNRIDKSCILINFSGKNIKLGYFNYEGEPIYIKSDIIALEIDQEVITPYYFFIALNSKDSKNQLDNLILINSLKVIPGIVSAISKIFLIKNFLKIKIDLPSIDKQKDIELNFFKISNINRNRKLNDLENEISLTISDQNSLLRHEIAGALRNVKSSLKFVQKIVDEKIKIEWPEVIKLTAHEKLSTTFESYLNLMQTDLERITNSVNRMVGNKDDQFKLINREDVNLLQFLNEYIERVKIRAKDRFQIIGEFQEDFLKENSIEKIVINVDKNLLSNVLDNLIENAEKHAFNYTSSEQHWISIQLIHFDASDLKEIQINVCNNGNPLPKDITHTQLIRKGQSFGENSGSGIGMWYVNKVMKLMGGEFTFTDETMERYSSNDLVTSMELTLPSQYIYNNNESTLA